jgi:NADH dehydrogenase FAD-containing subunit
VSRPTVAIVGANFAGLTAAQHLGREYAVTVIDRSPWFEWLPNIHELLSGVKRPADLRLPRRRLVSRAGHRFVRATVTAIDARAGRLTTSGGRQFDFDLCIVAVGAVNDTFGIKGADRHAMPFKSVDDCAAIGRALATLARRPGKHSVVIVGGGLEGIEALGEILRRHRHREGLSIRVIEAGPRLLPGTPLALDAAVRARCAEYGVHVHTRSPVIAVTPKRVQLSSGERLRSDLTIWTGGGMAPPLLRESGLVDKPRQWAPVTAALQSKRFGNLFVIGDAAALPHPLGKQAYYAMQMGECAAGNAVRALAGRELRPFRPSRKPMLVAFGDLDTFLVSARSVIASPGLSVVKEAVFQLTMAEIDPPLNAPALRDSTARLGSAARKLALPALASATGRGRSRR